MRSIKLPDPEKCRICKTRGRVCDSRARPAFRWRRHLCPKCGFRWSTYQTVLNPRRLTVRAPG